MGFKNDTAIKGKKGFQSSGKNDIISTGTSEAWNVAQGYVHIKILRLLIQLDRYDLIAQFGTEEMDQEFNLDQSEINKRRIEGLQRFISTLNQLIGNVGFAIKKEDDPKLKGFVNRLKNVENVMPHLFAEEEDQVSHRKTLIIDEELFCKCLKIVKEIKDALNTPINKAGLIFRESDDIDLDKIMKDIIEGG